MAELGTWEDALPTIGQRVQVDFEPGCYGETTLHAIWPVVQGKQGAIAKFHHDYRGDKAHTVWVKFDEPLSELLPQHLHEWFKLSELRPILE